jgi:hypothetical protein
VLTSNSASFGGAALIVYKSGLVDLVNSVFQSNGNDDDGIGIVNRHGQVQCGVNVGCLPVCTLCRGEEVPSPPPTLPPTLSPTLLPMRPPRGELGGPTLFVGVGVAISTLCLSVMIAVTRSRRKASRSGGEGSEVVEAILLLDVEVKTDDAAAASESDSVELTARSAVMRSYEASPAPVFVVSRNSMRIKIWSRGMMIATPMILTPVGRLVSELPFVNHTDGNRLHRALLRSFDNLAENDGKQTFVLHLLSQGRNVLLEMVATHIWVTEPEPFIVLTGRELDSSLAGLMACESAVAPSVTEEEEVELTVPAGSARFDRDSTTSQSTVSSLTMPSLTSETPQSEEAGPQAARPKPGAGHAGRRFVALSAFGNAMIDDTTSPATGSSLTMPSLTSAMPQSEAASPQAARPMSGAGHAGRRFVALHSSDRDTSSALALSQIVHPLQTANEMQTRPTMSALLEDVRTSRKRHWRTARQSTE